jgi:hypothetical protein
MIPAPQASASSPIRTSVPAPPWAEQAPAGQILNRGARGGDHPQLGVLHASLLENPDEHGKCRDRQRSPDEQEEGGPAYVVAAGGPVMRVEEGGQRHRQRERQCHGGE